MGGWTDFLGKIGGALTNNQGLATAIGVGGNIIGSVIQSRAAGKAAETQNAAQRAASETQAKSSADALEFLKQAREQQAAAQEPYRQAGNESLATLRDLLKPGGELAQGFTKTFTAPTADQVYNDPAWQVRMAEGRKAIERSAAARGGLNSPATQKALDSYSQDQASQEYGNVYNRALGEWQNERDTFNQNQAARFGRLSSVAGLGANTANQLGQSVGQFGNAAAALTQNAGNNLAAAQFGIGQTNAQAGIMRGGIFGNAANQVGSNIAQLPTLKELLDELRAQRQKAAPAPAAAAPVTVRPGNEPFSYGNTLEGY